MSPHAMTVPSRRRESGALMLTVLFLLAIMAALSFGLGRGAGMDMRSVATDYERRKAAYLAQAALAAAKWTTQVSRCTYTNLAPFSFAGATLSATVAKASGAHMSVTANATLPNGSAASITRPSVGVVDFSNTGNANAGGGKRDTTIDSTVPTALSGAKTLVLTSGQSRALLYWPLGEIPKNAQLLSATLTLYQSGSSTVPRTVNLHRVTTVWDSSATWTRARSGVAWNGGDFGAVPALTFSMGAASSYQLNLTALVDTWASGAQPNDGMLLRLADPNQSATLYSFEGGGATVPSLALTFAKGCP